MDEQQRAEYAALLEQRRAAHVEAWREGAGMNRERSIFEIGE